MVKKKKGEMWLLVPRERSHVLKERDSVFLRRKNRPRAGSKGE